MARPVYPIISTTKIAGHEPRHTVVLDGREVEIGDDELPVAVDQAVVLEHSGQRRRDRVSPVRRAFVEALGGAASSADHDD